MGGGSLGAGGASNSIRGWKGGLVKVRVIGRIRFEIMTKFEWDVCPWKQFYPWVDF